MPRAPISNRRCRQRRRCKGGFPINPLLAYPRRQPSVPLGTDACRHPPTVPTSAELRPLLHWPSEGDSAQVQRRRRSETDAGQISGLGFRDCCVAIFRTPAPPLTIRACNGKDSAHKCCGGGQGRQPSCDAVGSAFLRECIDIAAGGRSGQTPLTACWRSSRQCQCVVVVAGGAA